MKDLQGQSKTEAVSCYSAIFQVVCLDTEVAFLYSSVYQVFAADPLLPEYTRAHSDSLQW